MVSIDLNSQSYKRAPHQTLLRLSQEAPVHTYKVPLLGKVRLVTSYSLAQNILKNGNDFVVDAEHAGKRGPMGLSWAPRILRTLAKNMLSLDDPDHLRLRRLSDVPFRAASVQNLSVRISEKTAEILNEFETGSVVDLVPNLTQRLPLAVICELLGLPDADRHKFSEWMLGFTNMTLPFGLVTFLPTLTKIETYLRTEIAERRLTEKDGLVSQLVRSEAENNGFSDDELVAMIMLLFIAGHETTTHLMSTAFLELLTNSAMPKPDRWTDEQSRLIVAECLRYHSPVQATKPRFVRNDTNILGHEFHRGETTMVSIAACNMDPIVFTDPRQFDPERAPNRHLSFGSGAHICLGLHLAKLETEIVLRETFKRWPDMILNQPIESLKWVRRFGMRGLRSLPVRLT